MSETIHIDQMAYSKGYLYQLREPCACTSNIRLDRDIVTAFYTIFKNGVIVGNMGYAWNGANKPAINTKSFVRPSCFHDIICQAIADGLLDPKWRGEADRLMRRIAKVDRMNKLRRWWTFKAVFNWGRLTAEKTAGTGDKEIFYIPKRKLITGDKAE